MISPEATYTSRTWNGMIHPLTGLQPAGMLWYQGEANRFHPELYSCQFPALITDYRNKFQQPDMTFMFVSLAPWEAYSKLADMREAQFTATQLPNVGYAIALDLGDAPRSIHPRRKAEIGRRLAERTMHLKYGAEQPGLGPEVVDVQRSSSGDVIVKFEAETAVGLHAAGTADCDQVGSAKCCSESPFEASSADEQWSPVETWKLEDTKVVLQNLGSNVTQIRFQWQNYPQCVLLNGEGSSDDHKGIAARPFLLPIKEATSALRGVRRHQQEEVM